ncbi:MAG: hypothetical protein U0835_17870 [Isosphaeraceae bacterium]
MAMRRAVNGLVWLGLSLGVPGVFLALAADAGPSSTSPPGHTPAACRPCQNVETVKGRPLPFEIDDQSVTTTTPTAGSAEPGVD